MKDVSGLNNPMFGRVHSEESRKKMSEALKGKKRKPYYGRPVSEETRKKMSESRKGIVNSRESIEKNRIANTGKKRTPEQKAKIGKALSGQKRPWMAGANNPRWRGGVTSENLILRSSLEYRQWRKSVFERDNYLCVIGGKEHGNKLNADHVKAFASHPELRFDISNGRTLCEACHKKTDTYGRPTKYQ